MPTTDKRLRAQEILLEQMELLQEASKKGEFVKPSTELSELSEALVQTAYTLYVLLCGGPAIPSVPPVKLDGKFVAETVAESVREALTV